MIQNGRAFHCVCKLDSHFGITVEQKNTTHHPVGHLAAHVFPMCNACDSSPAISTATTVTPFACWFLDASTPQFPDITHTLQPRGTLLVFPFECPFWGPGLQPCRVKTWEDRSFPCGRLGVMVIGATPVSTPRGMYPSCWEGLEWHPLFTECYLQLGTSAVPLAGCPSALPGSGSHGHHTSCCVTCTPACPLLYIESRLM